jgi:hypothetical protein
VELLCDVILSPGTKALHKPILGQMKILPSAYIALINTYISARYSKLLTIGINTIVSLNNGEENAPEELFNKSIDVTSSLESLLLFQEFRACTASCLVPLLSYVVDLLIESVDRALHAVGDCGAVGWPSIQAVSERVCVIYAMLRDINSTVSVSMSTSTTTIESGAIVNGSIMHEELASTADVEVDVEVILEKNEVDEKTDNQLAAVVCRAADCLFEIMKKGSLPKECMASAAVALCTTLRLPNGDYTATASNIAAGLFMDSSETTSTSIFSSLPLSPPQGWVATHLIENRNSSLPDELQKLDPIPALCMLRGFLQSTPTADLVAAVLPSPFAGGNREGESSSWHFLTDGVICNVCNAMDASFDRKFKSLALQTLLISVDHLIGQYKNQSGSTSSGSGGKNGGQKNKKDKKQKKEKSGIADTDRITTDTSNTATSPAVVPLTSFQQHLLLRVLWQSWDDTQVNAWRLAYQQFAQLLDLIGLQNSTKALQNKEEDDFFVSVAKDLLALGPDQKRRYSPLTALVAHLGAEKLLSLHSDDLIEETLAAMAYNVGLTSPATLMLTVLWKMLREETAAAAAAAASNGSDTGAAANEAWQAHWVPQITKALCSRDETTRKVVCAYAVPAVAEIEPKAFEILFREVAVKATEDVAVSYFIN